MLEVNFPQHSDAPDAGVNANSRSTFGALAECAGVEHVALPIAANNAVLRDKTLGHGHADLLVPERGFAAAVDCALCVGFAPQDHRAKQRRDKCASVCDGRRW